MTTPAPVVLIPSSILTPLARFLNRRRVRVYAWIVLIVSLAVWGYELSQANGLLNSAGNPIGGDFVTFHAASSLVLDGRPGDAYDLAAMHQAETKALGGNGGAFAWHYPPIFLLFVAGLATLPYLGAFVFWCAATAGMLYVALRSHLRDGVVLAAAIGFPGILTNLTTGQTGFLSAGILALGLSQLARRPFFGGAILGCIVYKPHFAPLVFLVLLATNRRQAFAGAVASAVALSALSFVLFGPGTWRAFIDNIPFASDLMYEGHINLLKMTSVSATLTQLGLPRLPTQALQLAVSLTVAFYTIRLWRSAAPERLKHATLCFSILLAAPFAFNYDLVIMGLGLLYLGLEYQATGWHRWEHEVILLAWIAPAGLIAVAALSGLVLMPVLLAALMVVTYRRAHQLADQSAPRMEQGLPEAA
jgi:hypothetical protein